MSTLPKPHLLPKPAPEVSFHYAARIAEGEYQGYCRSASTYWDRRFKRWTCALQFDVLDDNLQELAKLTCFMNLGKGDAPYIGRCSNYWKAWVSANGSQPSRNAKLADRIFIKRYARVLVGDTKKDWKQVAVDSDSCYSQVRQILSWDTGSTINQIINQVGNEKGPAE